MAKKIKKVLFWSSLRAVQLREREGWLHAPQLIKRDQEKKEKPFLILRGRRTHHPFSDCHILIREISTFFVNGF